MSLDLTNAGRGIGGLLQLSGRFVPLALALLAPILVAIAEGSEIGAVRRLLHDSGATVEETSNALLGYGDGSFV